MGIQEGESDVEENFGRPGVMDMEDDEDGGVEPALWECTHLRAKERVCTQTKSATGAVPVLFVPW